MGSEASEGEWVTAGAGVGKNGSKKFVGGSYCNAVKTYGAGGWADVFAAQTDENRWVQNVLGSCQRTWS